MHDLRHTNVRLCHFIGKCNLYTTQKRLNFDWTKWVLLIINRIFVKREEIVPYILTVPQNSV